jgi:hypothetical protein
MIDLARRPLRILMTNNTLAGRAGSELYVRDLALEFMKRGHLPVAYSPSLGEVAEELRAHTIPVLDDLDDMEAQPDLIHGHHHHETMTAALRYPRTPILFVCHGWVPWEEMPPVHPNIVKYVAVDDLCRERLLTTRGIAPEKTATIYNFADLDRFRLRPHLPSRPKAALVFSNYMSQVPEPIRAACSEAGIEQIDIKGAGSGQAAAAPEQILGQYDIVFAKARSAIEALASGCAVVVADASGLGGMVTTANLEGLRRLNFGVRSMKSEAVTQSGVAREIARYDAQDALRVSETIRTVAGLKTAVDAWLDLYHGVIADWKSQPSEVKDIERMRAGARYLRQIALPLKTRGDAERELIEAKRQEDARRAELSSLRSRLDEMSAAWATSQAELDARQEDQRRSGQSLDEALSASRAKIDSQQEKHQREIARLSAAKADLAVIRNSRAWRLIQQYRKMRQWFKKRR